MDTVRMSVDLPTNNDWSEYDWAQVFPATGNGYGSGDYSGTFQAVPGGHGERIEDVTAERIAEVIAFDASSPEGWGSVDAVARVRLTDDSYGALTAWADTTGWGCRADAQWRVANNKGDAIRYGLDNDGRMRLGLVIDQ